MTGRVLDGQGRDPDDDLDLDDENPGPVPDHGPLISFAEAARRLGLPHTGHVGQLVYDGRLTAIFAGRDDRGLPRPMVVEQSMPAGVVPLPTGPAADPTRTAAALLAALPDDVRTALQALTRQETS